MFEIDNTNFCEADISTEDEAYRPCFAPTNRKCSICGSFFCITHSKGHAMSIMRPYDPLKDPIYDLSKSVGRGIRKIDGETPHL